MTTTKKKFVLATLMVVSVIVGLGVAEGLLRATNKPKDLVYGWRFVGGHRQGSPLEANQLGFRGRKIQYGEDDKVIVLLGDSQVQADAASYYFLPEVLLERHLQSKGIKAKVFSVGASGYGQDQMYLALQEYFKQYRADLIVHWFTQNDYMNNTFPTHDPYDGTPKPTFWLENGELKGPHKQPGEVVHRFKLMTLFHRFVPADMDKAWAKRTLPKAYEPAAQGDNPNHNWDNQTFLTFNNLSEEKTDKMTSLYPRSDRAKYAIKLTSALLHRIRKETVEHGGKFFVFQIDSNANRLDTKEPEQTCEQVGGKYYFLRKSMSQSSETFEGLHYKKIPVGFSPSGFTPSDGHLNQYANEAMMGNVADYLTQSGLLDQSDTLSEALTLK